MVIARQGEEIVCPKRTLCGRIIRHAEDRITDDDFLQPKRIPRRRVTDLSAAAAVGSPRCGKTTGGEFTCGGVGSVNERPEEYSFRHRRVSASDPETQPRALSDHRQRVELFDSVDAQIAQTSLSR